MFINTKYTLLYDMRCDDNNDKIPNIYSTASYFTIYNCFVIVREDIFLKSLNPKSKGQNHNITFIINQQCNQQLHLNVNKIYMWVGVGLRMGWMWRTTPEETNQKTKTWEKNKIKPKNKT